jgi:hypothetical protein
MLICLSGWKNSGKDTVANYLIEEHNAVRVAFADPLKDMVAQEFDIPRSYLDDPKFKESPLSEKPVLIKDDFVRNVAKFMFKEFRTAYGEKPDDFTITDGVMYGIVNLPGEGYKYEAKPLFHTPRSLAILKGSTNRVADPNYWTNKAFSIIKKNADKGKLVVVTDLRYKSEMVQLKGRFGKEVVFVRINRHKESPSNDPSERDLDGIQFDYNIDNCDTLENTYKQMEFILKYVQNAALDELAVETEKLGLEFK